MSRSPLLALVLAGGEGARLRPLTAYQAKPAVAFTAGYRIVDFVLANLVNSRVPSIYLLAQYKPQTLIEHVYALWRDQASAQGSTVEVIVPEALDAQLRFKGTADAVYCCIDLIERHDPEVVAVFAADHIYRMDVRQMAGFHLSRAADVSVAGIAVPIEQARSFGVMATDADANIVAFEEKPHSPRPIPGRPELALASMGNYLFKPSVLIELLRHAVAHGGTDFGGHILPALPSSGLRVLAYDFARNQIPGLQPYEERMYWRDVGTLEALTLAQRDVEGERPRFDLRNRAWPIRRDLLTPLGRLRSAPLYQSDRYAA
jgi:glucose-1-phosphate adenylyltransferase